MRYYTNRYLRGRRQRGFTLMEVVTATVISAILILVAIGWVLSLISTSASSVEQTANTTNANYISSRLGEDLLGAVDCSPYGLDTPFYSFSPTQIAFYERVGATSTSLTASATAAVTTLNSQANEGDTSASVTSTTNLVTGQNVDIGSPSGIYDAVTITSISSGAFDFSPALTHTYVVGTSVTAPTSVLSVASASGITPGTQLTIGTGTTQETATVSYVSGSSVQLLNALNYAHASGTTVTFNGTIELVSWRVSGGLLQRAVISGGSGACSSGNFVTGFSSPTWITIASNVKCQLTATTGENCITGSPSDPIFFQAYSGGTLQSAGNSGTALSCTGTGASLCYFSSVVFSADLANANTTGSTLKFSQSFPVNLSGSRLGS